MTPEELKEIRERCDAATKGPWEWRNVKEAEKVAEPYFDRIRLGNPNGLRVLMADNGVKPDATFIAHARSDIPRLLDEVERLEAVVRGKPPLNVEASQTIPKLFDQINMLQEKLAVAEEALQFIMRNGPICRHDDPSWCEDRCRIVQTAKKALAKIREEK